MPPAGVRPARRTRTQAKLRQQAAPGHKPALRPRAAEAARGRDALQRLRLPHAVVERCGRRGRNSSADRPAATCARRAATCVSMRARPATAACAPSLRLSSQARHW